MAHHTGIKNDSVRSLSAGEKFVELRCTTGNHYKTYMLWLRKSGSTWEVAAFWGRIGGTVQSQIKGKSEDHQSAEQILQKWLKKKMRPHGSDSNFYVLHEQFDTPNIITTRAEALEIQLQGMDEILNGRKATFESEGGNTMFSYLEV